MKLQQFLFLFILYFITANTAKTQHIVGSEITYKYIDSSKYTVTIHIYTDCNGGSFTAPNLVASSGNTTVPLQNLSLVSKRDITNSGCSTSVCRGGSFPYGVQESIYRTTLDLITYSECDWTISWEDCCRNNGISSDTQSQNLYTMATLNKCLAPGNSSPQFINKPSDIALVCVNKDVSFNHGAVDLVDSEDSLSYELVSGLTASNSPLNYSDSFSSIKPINFLGYPNENAALPGGFHFDPITGLLSFRPIQADQVGVIVVEVKEWRKINDTMRVIGSTRRDIQTTVMACHVNSPPIFTNDTFDFYVCYGNSITIPIEVTDIDTSDKVTILWDAGVPGAHFIQNNLVNKIPKGSVDYYSYQGEPGKSYSFTITARDNACYPPGVTTQTYNIHIPPIPESSLIAEPVECNKLILHHITSLDTSYNKVHVLRDGYYEADWHSYNYNGNAISLTPGRYLNLVSFNDNYGCQHLTMDSVFIKDNGDFIYSKEAIYCDGDSFQITPRYNNPGSNLSFDWYEIRDTLVTPAMENSPYYSGILDGITHIVGTTTIGNCQIIDSTRIAVNARPNIRISSDFNEACITEPNIHFADSSEISSGIIISRKWDFDNGNYSSALDTLYPFQTEGNHLVKLTCTSDKGCEHTDSLQIRIKPLPSLYTIPNKLNIKRDSYVEFFAHNNTLYHSQWQIDSSHGFVDISDQDPYFYVQFYSLRMTQLEYVPDSSKYRCIVTLDGCKDTTNIALLTYDKNMNVSTHVNSVSTRKYSTYPNPAKQIINIDLMENHIESEVMIINSLGAVILKQSINQSHSSIDISRLPKGVYFVVIDADLSNKSLFIKE